MSDSKKNQCNSKTILYIGGFQLPDKNAAALRVMANAKAFRACGYRVVFINALADTDLQSARWTQYEDFECYEYKREPQKQYLLRCDKIVSLINKIHANIVVAYNHPAIALNCLRKYCQKHGVRCIADATEWYMPTGNTLFRLIKGFDTEFRMRYVQSRMDGVIAISEYLYQYYKDKVKTIKVPPLVDLDEKKWKVSADKKHDGIKLIYAGSPSAQKEKLDVIVDAVEKLDPSVQAHLDVVGVTEEQFNSMYGCKYNGNRCSFWGRVPNTQVIKMTKEADWTIILRENNKVVKAGFPTKVVESISCGTPVIANKFSNIEEYLTRNDGILFDNIEKFDEVLFYTIQKGKIETTRKDIFHYNRFIEDMRKICG